MGIGVSLILIAVGAILTWAVETSVSGLDVNAVGVILMIVGLVGLVLSLAFWSTWWGPGYFRHTVVSGPDRSGVDPSTGGARRRGGHRQQGRRPLMHGRCAASSPSRGFVRMARRDQRGV